MEPVCLRALDMQDLERLHSWHNDESLYESLGGTYRHVSHASEEEWLRSKTAYSPNEVNLAICLKDTGQHIGNIYLKSIDWVARHAELHIFIGESDCRSKGCGSAAVKLMLDHAFKDLGLQRVYLSVLEDNVRAIKAYEKCGFTVEGKLRRHAFKAGEFKDIVVMGICSD